MAVWSLLSFMLLLYVCFTCRRRNNNGTLRHRNSNCKSSRWQSCCCGVFFSVVRVSVVEVGIVMVLGGIVIVAAAVEVEGVKTISMCVVLEN